MYKASKIIKMIPFKDTPVKLTGFDLVKNKRLSPLAEAYSA